MIVFLCGGYIVAICQGRGPFSSGHNFASDRIHFHAFQHMNAIPCGVRVVQFFDSRAQCTCHLQLAADCSITPCALWGVFLCIVFLIGWAGITTSQITSGNSVMHAISSTIHASRTSLRLSFPAQLEANSIHLLRASNPSFRANAGRPVLIHLRRIHLAVTFFS